MRTSVSQSALHGAVASALKLTVPAVRTLTAQLDAAVAAVLAEHGCSAQPAAAAFSADGIQLRIDIRPAPTGRE